MGQDKKTCFIIMPISGTSEKHTEVYWNDHYERFLKNFIEKSFDNLIVKKSEALRGDILNQIIFDLVYSDVVVADITDFNPNVMWELGIRQSFKHGTITIADEEYNKKLPFDFAHKGTLFYDLSHHPYSEKHDKFLNQFKKAIKDCLDNPSRPDSHVLENVNRGSFFETIKKEENIRKLDALLEEIDANLAVFNHTKKIIEENQSVRKDSEDKTREKKENENNTTNEQPKKLQIVTSRFRYSAIELLIITRYLDQPKEFYNEIGLYFRNLITDNDQLISWEYKELVTESWLNRFIPIHIKKAQEVKEKIETIRSSIFKMV